MIVSQPPPSSPVALGAAVGVAIDAVDSGGGGEFGQPEEAIRPRGPIANSLDQRMTGSAVEIDAAGDAVTQRSDGITNARIGNKR